VVGALSVSQSDSALAAHSHSLAVATLIVPDPPADVTLDALTVRVTAHRCVVRPVGFRRVVDEEPQPVANAVRKITEKQRRRTPPRCTMSFCSHIGRLHASDSCCDPREQHCSTVCD
jgi:hypothetical protein